MANASNFPPFPSHEAFASLREQIDQAKQEATDRALLQLCEDQRREWRSVAVLVSADPGTPAKKLTKEQRAKVRSLAAAEIGGNDIAALVGWFEAAIEAMRLRHARAA